jgi:adenine-specific DNA-methyltransferase
MARIEDEIGKISDPILRSTLLNEVKKLKTDNRFGLVFEEHLPELVPIYNAKVKARSLVARRSRTLSETFNIVRVQEGLAEVEKNDGSRESIPVEELTVVRRFGEPMYPALQTFDRVRNGDTSQPHHILIEADNYHALQLLEYCYSGKVDCIYIDPPYNTGAKDWKYNNDYVDGNDTWRHSKWLSMMSKRLQLAKRLLKPDNGVLIVTIDEHEVHHLGMLMERVFPGVYQQMVTIVINQKGVERGRLSRVEEYALFAFMPEAMVPARRDDLLSPERGDQKRFKVPRWEWLLRGGNNSLRVDSPNMFYPIHIDPQKKSIIEVGKPLPIHENPTIPDDKSIAWPIKGDGTLGNWQVGTETLSALVSQGYVRLGGYDEKRNTWTILYLNKRTRERITSREILITGRDPISGAVELEYAQNQGSHHAIKTVWHRGIHDSGVYGSTLLKNILGADGSKFSFPKSIYSVRDAIGSVVRDRPDAILIDFFAGSGTTLNAVNLLNITDNGNRQCILVTNNEVSEDEATYLTEQGQRPGTDEWNQHGICQSVTFPRNKFTMIGHRNDGSKLEGDYLTGRTVTKEKSRSFKQLGFSEGRLLPLTQRKQLIALIDKIPQSKITADMPFFVDGTIPASVLFDIRKAAAWLDALEDHEHITDFYLVTQDTRTFNSIKEKIQERLGPIQIEEAEKRPLSEGFPANLEYFKLDFLDPAEVQMGRQFAAILPMLWMIAGARGPLPDAPEAHAPWLIPSNCPFAVLIQERRFKEFYRYIENRPDLTHVFIVTNSSSTYHNLREELDIPHVVQLYKDFLQNFKINFSKF